MERSCELGWQRSMALDLGMCGLSAKCPDRFMCLNTWSQLVALFWTVLKPEEGGLGCRP